MKEIITYCPHCLKGHDATHIIKAERERILKALEESHYLQEFDNEGCIWFTEEQWNRYIGLLKNEVDE